MAWQSVREHLCQGLIASVWGQGMLGEVIFES